MFSRRLEPSGAKMRLAPFGRRLLALAGEIDAMDNGQIQNAFLTGVAGTAGISGC
jgi:hypothetical protein